MRKHKGFTLIELLIVIGVIAILAAIIFVAVDPARRFAEARNAERWSSVNSILNAYLQFAVDNRDHHANINPGMTQGVPYMISNGSTGTALLACAAQPTLDDRVNLDFLVDEYIASIPIDPGTGVTYTAADTGYYAIRTTSNRITVASCAPEEGETISVSR